MRTSCRSRRWCALALASLLAASALAETPGTGGEITPTTTYFEQGILIRSGEVVQALGPDLMGDAVNEYSGGLQFTQTDVSLPGNNALEVQVGRHKAVGTIQAFAGSGLFANWDLDIPHLRTIAAQSEPNWYGARTTGNFSRCSQFAEPPSTLDTTSFPTKLVLSESFWDGYQMYIPGVGNQTLLRRNTNAAAGPVNLIYPSDGTPEQYPILTKNHWQISCLSSLDNGPGEGFEARSPDGVRYRFDHIAVRPYKTLTKPGVVPRVEVWILPTRITDRFGNWVQYTYTGADGWRVSSITSSDGRSITFAYNGNGNRIQSVSDGTRTWTYGYSSSGTLQTVTRPDQSSWTFDINALAREPYPAGDPGCDNEADWSSKPPVSGTITHPSGAVGTFVLTLTTHGRAGVPGDNCVTTRVGRFFGAWSLTSKTLSGPGMPAMTWSYAYSPAAGSFAPCNGCVNAKAVTITDPQGHVTVNTYGTQYAFNEGLLLNSNVGGGLRVTSYTYRASDAGPYPAKVGGSNPLSDSMSRIYTPQSQRTIVQQGATFSQTVDAFDGYARPTSVTKVSSLGYSRSESAAYFDQTSLWVIGQVESHTVAGVVAKKTIYNAATALPKESYSFGKLASRYVFNADGTLDSIKDGLSQTTRFTNYKRGLPQNVSYADGTGISAVVNNIGTIASVTNEAGKTTSYGYDAMGRLASKTPPGGNPTSLLFVQVPSDEYGIEPNHWRQTITTGNAVTVNVFDARWRKRVSVTYDATDPTNTQRMQRFKYDPYNRTTSASYPARSLPSIDSYAGTSTVYDAVGRVTVTSADSELGTLTTTTEYLTNFLKRHTDARGSVTTTAFQAFDDPDQSKIASVAAPEGVNVTFERDVFGKPRAITRSGTYAGAQVSATRRYVYDANQLLCKTVEPEIGATIQSLDAANNISWRASGLNLPNPDSCDHASVPAAKMVAYAYDARNRVTGTGFGDGSPAIGRSYTPDGLPWTVVSNGSTWTYGYNDRRLLTSESLQYSSTTYNVGRVYDANGNLSELTYPDGATVTFAPNALGEPTQAGSYAGAVTHHPNGQVAGYTLGNGTVHTLTQNVRGLPFVNRDAGILQDQYAYDANGNVATITDQQEGVSTRSMSYDRLDRLTAVNAPALWGEGIYTYDPLGNIRTSVVGSRSSVHSYWNNRLDTITTNGTVTAYVYDAQGNITARGTQAFSFDQGNRMQAATGIANYTYDGLGRRVSISGSDGTYRIQVYAQDGQLLYSTKRNGMFSETTRYVYLGGNAIAEVSSSNGTTYLHTDVLGSVVATVGSVPAVLTYSCPTGWTAWGIECTQATTSTIAATVAGYSCPSGYTLSGSTCSKTTVTTSAATPSYSCAAGWTLSGSTCSLTTSTAATPVYACPAGWTLSGSTCLGSTTTPANVTWNCKGYGALTASASSSSGYYCLKYRVTATAYNNGDYRGEVCQVRADSYGLRWVGRELVGTTHIDCLIGPVPVYSCPSGATLSGTSCTGPTSQPATVSGYTCSSGTLSGSSCYSTSTVAANVSYSCAPGRTLSGTTCSSSSTSSTPGTPVYSCPSGYTLSGASCTIQGTATMPATANYSCQSGTLSGSNCLGALSRTRYEAYGNTAAGTVPKGIGFTGHVNDADTGLVYMQQRYYDPLAARFVSVDQIATDADTGAEFNRYEFAHSNPYRYTDPDGRYALPILSFIIRGAAAQAARNAAPAAIGAAAGVAIGTAVHSSGSNQDAAPTPSPAAGAPKPSTLGPGPHATDSIPARGPGRDFTPEEREKITEIGNRDGCHTCGTKNPGTKSGDFVPDHQPANGLNPDGGPQRLYPHCVGCSRQQGGEVNGAKTRGKPSSNGGAGTEQQQPTQQPTHRNLFDGPKTFGRIS